MGKTLRSCVMRPGLQWSCKKAPELHRTRQV